MITRLNLNDENVFAFSWRGKFDVESLRNSIDQLEKELRTKNKLNVYAEIQSIDGAELQAIWEDIKFGFNNYRELLNKIDKVAVVTDNTLIRGTIDAANYLVPGITQKSFTLAEADKAKMWVKGGA